MLIQLKVFPCSFSYQFLSTLSDKSFSYKKFHKIIRCTNSHLEFDSGVLFGVDILEDLLREYRNDTWKKHISLQSLNQKSWSYILDFQKVCCGSGFNEFGPDPAFQVNLDPGFWWQKLEKYSWKNVSFLIKNCNLLYKREHPALQKMKFINFFIFVSVILSSWIQIRRIHWIRIRIRNTAKNCRS